jgi:hypothetical protein
LLELTIKFTINFNTQIIYKKNLKTIRGLQQSLIEEIRKDMVAVACPNITTQGKDKESEIVEMVCSRTCREG